MFASKFPFTFIESEMGNDVRDRFHGTVQSVCEKEVSMHVYRPRDCFFLSFIFFKLRLVDYCLKLSL